MRRPEGYSEAMEERPYLRRLMALSPPAQAMMGFAALGLVSWIVGAALQLEAAAWPLMAAFAGFVVALGLRLQASNRGWVRVLGVLLIVALAIGVLLLAATLYY